MSENNSLLNREYLFEILVNKVPVDPAAGLLRINRNDTLDFRLELHEGAFNGLTPAGAVLHTDINHGEWTFLKFNENKSRYTLSLVKPSCSSASFRFAVNTDQGLLWEPDDYHLLLVDPAPMNIRLYTMIPNITGPISRWSHKLKDIIAMEFNAVHILPFTQMGSSESPYAASDLFSIDESLGSMDEFKEFAAASDRLGIKICLDMVLNHVSNENIICRRYAQWLTPDSSRPDGMKRAGCYHHDTWISWEDLSLLNYTHPDPSIREELFNYMLDYVLYWIDAAGGNNVMLRLDNLHSSDKAFIKWLLPRIRKKYPEVIILSEYFGAEHHLDEAVTEYGLNLLTANTWEYPFAPDLERYIQSIHSHTGLKYLLLPTSHDTEAAGMLFGTPESSIPRYAVCALMGGGTTGIVQGYEYGMPEKINFIGRNPDPPPQTGHDFTDFITQVNTLLKTRTCLNQEGNAELLNTGNNSLIVCRRSAGNEGDILIAVNLDIYNGHRLRYHVPGKADTLLVHNAESGFSDHDGLVEIKLAPCGVCAIRIKS